MEAALLGCLAYARQFLYMNNLKARQMMYNGKIERCSIKKKKKINIKSLLLWYLGIVISFLPILIDMIVYLSKNENFTKQYWIGVCLRGDVLWILATIIILTAIDYFSNDEKKGTLKLVCAIIGMVLWGVVFAIWSVFKYIYTVDYERNFPIIVTFVVSAITLMCCSPLQIKIEEVKD